MQSFIGIGNEMLNFTFDISFQNTYLFTMEVTTTFCCCCSILLLICTWTFTLDPGKELKINTTNFHHCIFNLLEFSTKLTQEAVDVTEQILIQNQGTQLWNILTLRHSTTDIKRIPQIDIRWLKESCSVNIVTIIEGRKVPGIEIERVLSFPIFGSRVYSTKNTLLIVMHKDMKNNIGFGFGPNNIVQWDIFISSCPETP